MKYRAEISPHRAPLLESICGSAVIAGLLVFIGQIALVGGFDSRRLPFQAAVATGGAIAAGLLAPLPYLLASHMFTFGNGSLVSVFAPPMIALFAWSSIVLCRREQILRAAPLLSLSDLHEQTADAELVRVHGVARELPGNQLFVSQVGRIPGVYLKELSFSYEASQAESYYSPRKKRGRRGTRYGWTITHKEVSKGDFLVADDATGATAVVDGARSAYLPLRIARFYNGVPVENWFSRPYPGDTRTQIEFIGTDTPVVVWGKLRAMYSGEHGIPAIRLVNDPYQNMLVVEGDEARIWTRRPLLGLLSMLVALGLSLFLVYCLATPGALNGR